MKRIALLVLAVMTMSSVGFAGGDIKEVEPVVAPFVEIDQIDESNFYVGLAANYNRVYSTEHKWWSKTQLTQDETGGLVGILGYNYNDYIAVEGRITKTFWDRDYSDTSIYSLFLKPQYKFRDDSDDDGYFGVYGLIGFGNTNVEGSSGDNDYQAWPDMIGQDIMDDTFFQWGVGVSYTLMDDSDDDRYTRKDTWSIFAEFVMSANDEDIDPTRLYDYDPNDPNSADQTLYDRLSVDGLTVGILYHF